MTNNKCPLGENCDLTVAYMCSAERAKEQARKETLLELKKRTSNWIENINLGPYKPDVFKEGVIKGLNLVLEGIDEKLAEEIE